MPSLGVFPTVIAELIIEYWKHDGDRVVNRLDSMGLNGLVICSEVAKHGALFAGSFPLGCYLGERYSGSDIDIFIRVDGEQVTATGRCDMHPLSVYIIDMCMRGHAYTSDKISTIEYPLVHVNRVFDLIYGGAKINVVEVVETPILDVIHTFDLSFCRTWYDGKSATIETQFPKLTRHKRGFLCDDRKSLESDRVVKYTSRGFTISTKDPRSPIEIPEKSTETRRRERELGKSLEHLLVQKKRKADGDESPAKKRRKLN